MPKIQAINDRTDLIILKNKELGIEFALSTFIESAAKAIHKNDAFFVALSGGSTPKAIYQKLSQAPFRDQIDWKKVFLFWSDERDVPLDQEESNYHMAMEAGFKSLPIPKSQIFPMRQSDDPVESALLYEKLIKTHVPNESFDLIMLGMGNDGHTASLFPKTHALKSPSERLTIENYIPEKKIWRLTLTFDAINAAKQTLITVFGKEKAEMVPKALLGTENPEEIPIKRVGTPTHKALWIIDQEAANHLESDLL